MKASKKIIGASCALVAAVALSAGSTFAWFSTNGTVTADNMEVKVTAAPALVISLSSTMGTDTAVSFTTPESSLTPATHNNGSYGVTETDYTGLVALSNPELISPTTGLIKDGATGSLAYVQAKNASPITYYVDYTVYIASAGAAITDKSLVVGLSNATELAAGAETSNAASIDYYVGDTVSATTYKGTLNLAGKDAATNDGTKTNAEVELVASGTEIPVATAGSLKVTMRVYYDGALKKDSTNAYVNSAKIDTTGVSLKSTFSVKATTPSP